MSRNIATQQPMATPVIVCNPPIPSTDPFTAILTSEFLKKNVWLEFFAFSTIWNPLLASAVGQQAQFTLDPGIDFIVQQINLNSESAAGTVVASPDYLLEIQETSGRSNFSDQAIHIANWTGQNRNSGAMPYNLPFPRYLRGNNTVNCKLTNLTATAARVDVAFIGIRVTYVNISRADLFGVPF